MDLIASRPVSVCQDNRQLLISLRPKHLLPIRNRKKKPRLMSKAAHLLQYGLEAGDHARARDTNCSICQERVSSPVVTPCQHVYCSECINEWLERSTRCPDCRQELDQSEKSDTCLSSTVTATSTSGRYSNSHWINNVGIPQVSEFKWDTISFGVDPQELADRLAALNQHVTTDQTSLGRSKDTDSAVTLPAATESGRRQWCIQRRMPLRNRAAHPLVFYGLPDDSQLTCRAGREADACAVAACLPHFHAPQPVRAVSMPLPLPLPRDEVYFSHSEHNCNERLITVSAEEQLSKMRNTSTSLADDIAIPIRCRAIAKCVWREWREFLQVNDGHDLYAGDLLKSLYSSFEQSIVDYGWKTDWRMLPPSFIEMMRCTARAAIESQSFSAARTHTL